MKLTTLLVSSLAVALSGCWTLSETEYPEVTMEAVPQGKSVKVKLYDYRSLLVNYIPVEGHESMQPGAPIDDVMISQRTELDPDMRWGMQYMASGRIVTRTVDELKRKGFKIDGVTPEYIIELKFEKPQLPANDVFHQVCYAICTLFTMEKNEVTCKATLNVMDAAENVLLTKDYEQYFCAKVWGPIPVGSPACHPLSTESAAVSWAQTAIADKAIVDATSFILGRLK